MTSLADALTAAATPKPGPRCTVAVVLDGLPPADRAALAESIARKKADTVTDADGNMHTRLPLSSQAIADVCYAKGVPLTLSPIARHRRGGCGCPKVAK